MMDEELVSETLEAMSCSIRRMNKEFVEIGSAGRKGRPDSSQSISCSMCSC